jgi:hypothetical protein
VGQGANLVEVEVLYVQTGGGLVFTFLWDAAAQLVHVPHQGVASHLILHDRFSPDRCLPTIIAHSGLNWETNGVIATSGYCALAWAMGYC